jgi:hypothetical protein
MRSLVVVVVLVLASSRVSAEPPSLTPTKPLREPGDKNPVVAVLLATGVTLGGFFLLNTSAEEHNLKGAVAGGALMAIGPSAGHIYTGQIDRAIGMSLVRAAGLGIELLGAIEVAESLAVTFGFCEGDECRRATNGKTGLVMMLIGATIYTAGLGADLVDAPRSVRRYNARRRATVGVTPSIARMPSGENIPVLALGGRF